METPSARSNRGGAAWRRGRSAETRAAWMLRLKGYRILARRFACAAGEVDIIARRGRLLVFCEVKARGDAALAAEAVTAKQRARVGRAAEAWLQGRPDLAGLDMRFDAVVMGRAGWPHHIVDAWRPAAS